MDCLNYADITIRHHFFQPLRELNNPGVIATTTSFINDENPFQFGPPGSGQNGGPGGRPAGGGGG